VRVRLRGIDRDGIGESPDGFGVLAALFVNQPQLVLRFGIVRVHRRRV